MRIKKIKQILKNNNSNNFNSIVFPIVKRIVGGTIAEGYESEERIKKRKRIQKLQRVLDKKDFQSIINKKEYNDIMIIKKEGGIIPVKPIQSNPRETLYYLDFKYNEAEIKRKNRKKKIIRILNGL